MVEALEWALSKKPEGPVRVFLDAQTAISRLQHANPGPGQALTLRTHNLARQLQTTSCNVTVYWIPDYRGVPGNKEADRAAKKTTDRPPTGKYTDILLVCAQKVCTEAYRITTAN